MAKTIKLRSGKSASKPGKKPKKIKTLSYKGSGTQERPKTMTRGGKRASEKRYMKTKKKIKR